MHVTATAGTPALGNASVLPAAASPCRQRGMELMGDHSRAPSVSFARVMFWNFRFLGFQVCLLCALLFIDSFGAMYGVVSRFSSSAYSLTSLLLTC